jgi:HAMP domain-containing protein
VRGWADAVAVGLLAGALGVTLIIRSIVRPMRRLKAAAQTIARGDVNCDVAVSGRDEIGQVGEAFEEMSTYLREMADAADEIAGGRLDVAVRVHSERDRLANAFVAMSSVLREELGDRSCMEALVEQMQSLQDNCLTDLQGGLESMARGDLTVTVSSCATPLLVEDGRRAGRLVSASTQQTSASAHEIASSAQDLAGTAEQLQQLLGPSSTSVGIPRMRVVTSTTKTSLRLSIAASRVITRAGRRPHSGCSAHQTSPCLTTALDQPRAPPRPVSALSPQTRPRGPWRGCPIGRCCWQRVRAAPLAARSRRRAHSSHLLLAGATPSRSLLDDRSWR